MNFNVFFYEAYAEEAPALQLLLPADINAGFSPRTVQEEAHRDPPAPLISIRTQSAVPVAWIPRLRGVLARTTGYDHLRALRQSAGPPLALACLEEYCSRAVAEQAALMWLSLLRRLPRQLAQFASFNRDGLTGGECAGRTLLVVGVGQIGSEVCRIGRGLGMNVLGVDLVQRHADVAYTTISDGLARADVIVCAMNLTPENRGYFSAALLGNVKRGAVFINVSRGDCSPAPPLLRALDEHILDGVALDVFNDEPALAVRLRTGKPGDGADAEALQELARRPNVMLTPHNAFNTKEALARKSAHTAQQVVHFLRHGSFLHPLPE